MSKEGEGGWGGGGSQDGRSEDWLPSRERLNGEERKEREKMREAQQKPISNCRRHPKRHAGIGISDNCERTDRKTSRRL